MQVTTLSIFRFHGLGARVWAFFQMQFARGPLRNIPGIRFHRLLGCGAGEGFDLEPDFGTYAILATWDSREAAHRGLQGAPVFEAYRSHCSETWTVVLAGIRAHGSWSGQAPFSVRAPSGSTSAVAVLTRATLAHRHLFGFWRRVPTVSALTAGQPGLHFKLGLGEWPITQLMTFSLWSDPESMHRFAYREGPHRDAMRSARAEGWFSEQLFARFEVLESTGTWRGRPVMARAEELAA